MAQAERLAPDSKISDEIADYWQVMKSIPMSAGHFSFDIKRGSCRGRLGGREYHASRPALVAKPALLNCITVTRHALGLEDGRDVAVEFDSSIGSGLLSCGNICRHKPSAADRRASDQHGDSQQGGAA